MMVMCVSTSGENTRRHIHNEYECDWTEKNCICVCCVGHQGGRIGESLCFSIRLCIDDIHVMEMLGFSWSM